MTSSINNNKKTSFFSQCTVFLYPWLTTKDGGLGRMLQLWNPIRHRRNWGAQEDLTAEKQLEANHPRRFAWVKIAFIFAGVFFALVSTKPSGWDAAFPNVRQLEKDQNVGCSDMQISLPVDFGRQQFSICRSSRAYTADSSANGRQNLLQI